MSIENLIHTKINILYTLERKQDAETLCSKYSNLGATVTLIEVVDDNATQKHLSRLYYFNESSSFKKIARSLADDLRNIEVVSPYHIQSQNKGQSDYSIWIVKRIKIQTNQIPSLNIKSNHSKSQKNETPKPDLIKCPKCQSFLRNDRLAKHLLKIHKDTKVVDDNCGNLLNQSTETNKPRSSEIILTSKRGIRIHKTMICDSCHSVEVVLWRYAESNCGPVNICGRCKSSVFNRSFDKVDAMNVAFQGGAFETNRRRH